MADATATTQPPPSTSRTLTYYHAGPLFTVADLTNNVNLSHLISTLSARSSANEQYHFQPVLPQDLEPRSLSPHSIRDTDLHALLSCDLALFTYDGLELDAGTVVEYLIAKFADIPSVILRTDFRSSGDQGQPTAPSDAAASSGVTGSGSRRSSVEATRKGSVGSIGSLRSVGKGEQKPDNWNLMSSFWPRTRTVSINSMEIYKTALAQSLSTIGTTTPPTKPGQQAATLAQANTKAAAALQTHVAEKVVKAMNEVIRIPPRLPKHLREGVYEWLSLMVGWRDDDEGDGEGRRKITKEMRNLLEGKIGREML